MTDPAESNVDDLAIRGLTASQERALPLLVSGMAPRQVAAEVGVSWGTIRNWCSQNDRFKGALAQLRREAHQHALAGVHSLAEGAVAALRDILNDTMTNATGTDRGGTDGPKTRSAGDQHPHLANPR